jgi:OOP family OmpA-OmpF porin
MPVKRSPFCLSLTGVALSALGIAAFAQSSAPVPAGSSTARLYGSRPYIGLSLGRSYYRTGCGAITLGCDSNDDAAHLYVRSMIGNFWGAELGYVNMGRMDRGGRAKAQGLNFSLVGKAPIGPVGVFGKVGTTYGHAESSSLAGGVTAGAENGFGLSYGAGVSFDFTPKLSATLGWDSHDFRFTGGGRDPVRATSLGLQYRY